MLKWIVEIITDIFVKHLLRIRFVYLIEFIIIYNNIFNVETLKYSEVLKYSAVISLKQYESIVKLLKWFAQLIVWLI